MSLRQAAELTPDQIAEIRATKHRTEEGLAKDFGVPKSVIRYIQSNDKVALSSSAGRGRTMWRGGYYDRKGQP